MNSVGNVEWDKRETHTHTHALSVRPRGSAHHLLTTTRYRSSWLNDVTKTTGENRDAGMSPEHKRFEGKQQESKDKIVHKMRGWGVAFKRLFSIPPPSRVSNYTWKYRDAGERWSETPWSSSLGWIYKLFCCDGRKSSWKGAIFWVLVRAVLPIVVVFLLLNYFLSRRLAYKIG